MLPWFAFYELIEVCLPVVPKACTASASLLFFFGGCKVGVLLDGANA